MNDKLICPICGKERTVVGLASHFKEHRISLLDWSNQTRENYIWYQDLKEKSKEIRKRNSPHSIEFYKFRFPELTEEEQYKKLKEHQKRVVKNSKKAIKQKEQDLKEKYGDRYEEFCEERRKNKGQKQKETEIRKMMFEQNMSRTEAEEIFRIKRVYASPLCIEYWTERGHTEEEAVNKVSEWQRLRSPRCAVYWTSRGYTEKEAAEKVSEWQKDVARHSNATKKYWECSDDDNKEYKRLLWVKFNNGVFKTLKEEGYIHFDITKEDMEKICESDKHIENYIKITRKYETDKEKYRRMVWFFTELNAHKVKNIEDRSVENHLDHIFSVSEGFRCKVKPEIIGSEVNLRIISKFDNLSKSDRCDITLEELLKRYESRNKN